MVRWRLLSRPDCALCEEFMDALREEDVGLAAMILVTDVDETPDWKERFGSRIPVLIDANGAVVCEGHFDSEKLALYRAS